VVTKVLKDYFLLVAGTHCPCAVSSSSLPPADTSCCGGVASLPPAGTSCCARVVDATLEVSAPCFTCFGSIGLRLKGQTKIEQLDEVPRI